VVVTVMDRDRMADYQAMAAELRAAGIRAEVYLGNPKNFGNQLKYADKRGSPVAIIEGGDEKARGVVQVKDLILGARIAQTATHEEWKDQPAQFECPRGDMVAEVRRILGRADGRRRRPGRGARLRAAFEAAGAVPVEADILQPAETLLDLYGEDIRARAYVTSDPVRGELMLRPDFTVPVVQMHMDGGADPARYTYAGEVFRKQEAGSARASEYLQVGYELFDGTDPARADAEVFALFAEVLAPLGLRAATGDIGLLRAAVMGLSTTDTRKAALLRHLWRPRRFRSLMDRFCGKRPAPAGRAAVLAAADPLADAGPEIGLRTMDEVRDRIARLKADAAEPPIGAGEAALLDALMGLGRRRRTCCRGSRTLPWTCPPSDPPWSGSRRGSGRWRPGAWTSRRWSSRRASGARRWSTTTASSSASSPLPVPTCRRWRRAGATTR
jgi:hypothetical protein